MPVLTEPRGSAQMIQRRLSCGLPIIAVHVPNKVVAIDCWVAAGSSNELDADNGVTHFLEHMLFKGTPRHGPGELDRRIMGVGGVWNAGTSKDFTHYYVTVAAPFFATALDCLSDMMVNASIDAAEFAREKDVILEEWRRKQDSPWGLAYDELYDIAFADGPYKRSVLGSFESISALDRDGMADYYSRYYGPGNMVLLIVGDIDPDAALDAAEAAFASFDRPVRPLPGRVTESKFQPGATRAVTRDVNETYMVAALPAPAVAERADVLALDLAQTVLAAGRSSRLYRRLKEETRLVNAVSAGYPTHKHESLFYTSATLDRANLAPALAEIRSVYDGLATDGPTPAELAKARRILRNSFQFGMETNTGRSGLIGYYHTVTGSTEMVETYLDALDHVTAADVASVAARYLTGEPAVVTVEPAAA